MPRNPDKPTVVLSVDWDYFFPDQDVYDWGHTEASGLFYEFLWTTRPHARDICKPDAPLAIDTMWPSGHEDFWAGGPLARGHQPKKLFLAESHRSMLDFVKGRRNLVIHNIDAHHDLGYGEGDDGSLEPDCGNWAATLIRQGRVAEYHQHYPTWRKQYPESQPRFAQATFDHSLPSGLRPDLVFACRSSCWCPPWADKDWMAFAATAGIACHRASLQAVQYVMKPRSFDETVARQVALEMMKIESKMMQMNASKTS